MRQGAPRWPPRVDTCPGVGDALAMVRVLAVLSMNVAMATKVTALQSPDIVTHEATGRMMSGQSAFLLLLRRLAHHGRLYDLVAAAKARYSEKAQREAVANVRAQRQPRSASP